MQDDAILKEYLKMHGVDNVLDLNYEELQEKYKEVVYEGVSYYRSLLQGNDVELEILDSEKKSAIDLSLIHI